ncbi:MAG: J domain-containing protein [Candidatus Binatia bacterium]
MKSISEYYKILGVDSSVTAEELKKVYRELVKEWHPDRLLHNPSLHKTAQQKLQEINEAYDQLQAHLANPEPRSSPPKNEPSRDTADGRRKATTATAKRPVAPVTQLLSPYVAFWRKHRALVQRVALDTVKDPWIIAAFIFMLLLAIAVDWF